MAWIAFWITRWRDWRATRRLRQALIARVRLAAATERALQARREREALRARTLAQLAAQFEAEDGAGCRPCRARRLARERARDIADMQAMRDGQRTPPGEGR